MHQGIPHLLTGNEIAAICTEFLCQQIKERPHSRKIVTTIVTTELLKAISRAYDVELIEVLTGFKYIGEMIHRWEEKGHESNFLFGAEESYGYLIGTHARDKDAIVSSCLIAEIALQAKLENKTLIDLLEEIYAKYGVFRERQISLEFAPGKQGIEEMGKIMQKLKDHPPHEIDGRQVLYIEDYEESTKFQLKPEPKMERLTLPKSNVLLFRLEDKSRLIVRPSGTEPKLKIYANVTADTIETCDERLDQLSTALKNLCTP